MSPARRRRAVEHLQRVFGVSQRWACQLVGQHRSTQRHQPAEPDHVWALDYEFDQTEDGRRLKLLNVVDEYTREALAIQVERRIDADATVSVLEGLVAERGAAPQFVRCDIHPQWCADRACGVRPAA